MALKDVVKVNRKTFFNPSAWLGYDYLKGQTLFVYNLFRNVFAKPVPAREETFEQAVKRLRLSEKAIHETQQTYFLYAIGFLILSIVTIIFGFYLLVVDATLAGFILSLAVTALLLSQAFRYHFWYFQMKYRKLGCTFAEWKRGKPFDQEEAKS